ncbi:MAG: catalase family peroxidase [Acidimicrobiales bacterium]
MDALARATGARPGMRVSHAKGILLSGTFTPSPRAHELTRAAHMQSGPVPVTVRFSNASTDPNSNDAAVGEPRGMSVKFYLPDGSTTDLVCQSWPVFIVSTPQEFLEFMHAQLDSPEAVGAFVGAHPRTAAALELIAQVADPPRSWSTMAFNSAVAYRLVSADGQQRFVRWRLVPEAGEQSLPEAERESADPDYLMTEILERLPVRFSVRAVLAKDGDPTDDSTLPWPTDREEVEMGVVELTGPDIERERGDDVLVMDPMRVTPGIEPSDDPILHIRTRAYSESVQRRSGMTRPDKLR